MRQSEGRAPNHSTSHLHIVQRRSTRSAAQYSLFGLWHLCSLDAPTVAAAWTWFVAFAYGIILPWTSILSMFLAVWMLYAADRLLDARTSQPGSGLEERHHFHHHYRKRFLSSLILLSMILAALLFRLTHVELKLFSALGALLFAYFFLIHVWPFQSAGFSAKTNRLPKEFAVGAFFSAAIFIPTVARVTSAYASLLTGAILFALVCTLNCLYVYSWEHGGDLSGAHWTTEFAVQHKNAVIFVTLTACAAVALWPYASRGPALTALACGLSLLCFLILHVFRQRTSAIHLRASVDLALLLPLPVIALAVVVR